MKTVFLTVNEEYVSGAGIIVGAVGTSSSKINVTFSEDWGGLVKYVTTKDSRGQNATVTMLTADELIEENVYEFDVPGSALSHEGLMSVTFTGFLMQGSDEAENATNTATCKLRVLPSDSVVADDSSITPPIAVQLQSQIESILSDITDARAAATEAAESASSASEDAATALEWRKISQSYAKGGTGRRTGEDTDNAKYYKEQAEASATSASESAANASESESAAAESETNANDSAVSAESYAVGGTGSRTGEDTDNAKYYKEQAYTHAGVAVQKASDAHDYAEAANGFMGSASDSADSASASATSASASATTATTKAGEASTSATVSRSYAVGDTETRQGEATDNAHYYYEQCKNISEGLSNALVPIGTITFENLPPIAQVVNNGMYNISNEFTTTSDFKEGAGHVIPAGSNIYKTVDAMWDVLAGSPVSGVKGDAELDYRKGNVNITKGNIGLGNVDNTSDSAKSTAFGTFTSSDNVNTPRWFDMSEFQSAPVPSLFAELSKLVSNVRYLNAERELNQQLIITLTIGDVEDVDDAIEEFVYYLANIGETEEFYRLYSGRINDGSGTEHFFAEVYNDILETELTYIKFTYRDHIYGVTANGTNWVKEQITAKKNEIIDLIYPVGSVITTTNSANPSTYWTGTTWVRKAKGKVLVGVDENDTDFDTVGETGGSKTNSHTHSVTASGTVGGTTLTAAQCGIRNHSHSVGLVGYAEGSMNTRYTVGYGSTRSGTVVTTDGTSEENATQAHSHSFTGSAVTSGAPSDTSNLQPYETVYYWERTA